MRVARLAGLEDQSMATRESTSTSQLTANPEKIHHDSPASIVGVRSGTHNGVSSRFAHIANRVSLLAGNYKTFGLMLAIVLVWAISGPIFKFSTTWQIVINTGTTIVTFLMVFLIQNTQNRDSLAVHLKLDEIIRAIDAADDRIIRAEDETDEELSDLKREYERLIDEAEGLEQKISE
jgi:low affinity Fe/Cu permease